jgi:translocator protein
VLVDRVFWPAQPIFACLVILALLAAIMVTIGLFWGLDKVSAYALVPYALWVGYATFFNAGIWWLNS